jgi:hypothetical protein
VERYLTAVNHKLHPPTGRMRATGALFTVEGGRTVATEAVTL